jgi:Undecaprenyl-phosphate glucose phosphotransferase
VEEQIGRSTPEIQVVGMIADGGSYPANDGRDAQRMLDELVAFGQREDIDLVIVARDASAARSLPDTQAALSVLPAEVKLFLDFGDTHVPIRGVSTLKSLSLLDLQRRPISDWSRLVKAVEDYTIASLAVVLLAPLLLVIAAAIRHDSPGPVLFRQRRQGLNHSIIHVWKFRTMRVTEDGDNVVQAVRGDHRVTRVGRFLRSTSLDELPQLFNVLKGEMSIVGPRPHPVPLNERFEATLPLYARRNRVRPGITGWAQINDCRGPTATDEDMRKRLEHDLHYIDNWSVWFDLSIIVATPFMGLVHKNAV